MMAVRANTATRAQARRSSRPTSRGGTGSSPGSPALIGSQIPRAPPIASPIDRGGGCGRSRRCRWSRSRSSGPRSRKHGYPMAWETRTASPMPASIPSQGETPHHSDSTGRTSVGADAEEDGAAEGDLAAVAAEQVPGLRERAGRRGRSGSSRRAGRGCRKIQGKATSTTAAPSASPRPPAWRQYRPKRPWGRQSTTRR